MPFLDSSYSSPNRPLGRAGRVCPYQFLAVCLPMTLFFFSGVSLKGIARGFELRVRKAPLGGGSIGPQIGPRPPEEWGTPLAFGCFLACSFLKRTFIIWLGQGIIGAGCDDSSASPARLRARGRLARGRGHTARPLRYQPPGRGATCAPPAPRAQKPFPLYRELEKTCAWLMTRAKVVSGRCHPSIATTLPSLYWRVGYIGSIRSPRINRGSESF